MRHFKINRRKISKLISRGSLYILTLLVFYSCETTEPLIDHYSPLGEYSIKWADLPVIEKDKDLRIGGFSGLYYKGNRVFYTITDRGPAIQNITESGATTKLLVPDYSPKLVKLELQDDFSVKVISQASVKNPTGENVSGKIPSGSWNNDEDFTNSENTTDSWGVYPGGIVMDLKNNFFWFSDQYQPGLYQMTVDGQWGRRMRPAEGLRRAFGNHTVSGGLTGIDFNSDGRIVTLMGRCLENNVNPDNPENVINYAMRRIALVNQNDNSDLSMFYFVESKKYDGIPEQFITLGDIATVNDTSFLVTEFGYYDGINRNLLFLATYADTTTQAVVGLEGIEGKTFETLSSLEWRKNELYKMNKILLMDLSSTSIKRPEGIAIINREKIAIIDNNQYGVTSTDPNSETYSIDKSSIKLEVITLPYKLNLD
ncbi:MAG: esterase-like activity of phytase family protein [Bacteroidota bacterium]